MRLVVRPEAQRELLAAQAWYEERSPGLGFEFARAVDAAIARTLRMPLAFPRIETEFRHVIARKFPYSIGLNPIRQTQPWHSLELALVVCDKDRAERQGVSCDPQIQWANRRSLARPNTARWQ